jgi:hypothetical protein
MEVMEMRLARSSLRLLLKMKMKTGTKAWPPEAIIK